MALLAEEIVEEWLNRDGWFTIRGAKLGVHEIDILAVKVASGRVECRQVEVQVSIFPISYISRVPKALQKNGRSATSAKRRPVEELRIGIREWIEKKFDHPRKKALRKKLYPGVWTRELVIHNVAHDEELQEIRSAGITIHKLRDVIEDLTHDGNFVEKAGGADFAALVVLGAEAPVAVPTNDGL
jgi:hypothetical protein